MTEIAAPSLLAELPARHAARHPGAVALHFDGLDIRYAELARDVERLAGHLWHGLGVRPGDRVAWLGANHPLQVALLYALARIGAVLLPLNFRLAPAEWDALVADCTPRHVFHDASCAQAARDLAQRNGLVAHAGDEGDDAGGATAPSTAEANSPVLLVYTSGTTSRPKAAVHTQA
ncbi:MAG: AMP-binding protein, partial [Variovorax sp.]